MPDLVQENRGISRSQLEHHIRQQYTPQIQKLREIWARLIKAETSCVDSIYCPLRSLKKEFSYTANAVRLHEYYFGSLGRRQSSEATPLVVYTLCRDFGSFEEWRDQFEALGLCARGWVVMGYDLKAARVHNFIADSHSEGVWSVLPLLVLDVYEHAYCSEFQSRQDYLRAFWGSIDWEMVDRRLRAARRVADLCQGVF